MLTLPAQDAADKAAFDTFPIVIGINTESRHETIQIGSQAGIPRNAALAAESSANRAFLSAIRS